MDNTWYTLFVVFLHWKVPGTAWNTFSMQGDLDKNTLFHSDERNDFLLYGCGRKNIIIDYILVIIINTICLVPLLPCLMDGCDCAAKPKGFKAACRRCAR